MNHYIIYEETHTTICFHKRIAILFLFVFLSGIFMILFFTRGNGGKIGFSDV